MIEASYEYDQSYSQIIKTKVEQPQSEINHSTVVHLCRIWEYKKRHIAIKMHSSLLVSYSLLVMTIFNQNLS